MHIITILIKLILFTILLGSQKLRASLYSSLIALINLLATNSRTLTNGNSKQKNNSISSTNQQILDSESIKFIKSLNFDQHLSERILEVICVDLTSGHDICKVNKYINFKLIQNIYFYFYVFFFLLGPFIYIM